MQLSELVQFLNTLDQYNLEKCYGDSFNSVDVVAKTVVNSNTISNALKDPIVEKLQLVDHELKSFVLSVQQLRQQVLASIANMEGVYFQNSSELFDSMRHDTADYILKRRVALSESSAQIFEQRLKLYSDWQTPGLIFRPAHLDAIEELVSLDPMYFVDTHSELIAPVLQNFHEDYSRRVRSYIINDYASSNFLSQLPQQQFGIVVAQTFLNFKPLEYVNTIISEVYELLKPGGAFVFTFNNCDYYGAVMLAEKNFACYTPGRLIKEHAKQVGYHISLEHTESNSTSFLELVRPGTRTSIRGGQTLALIKNNTVELDPINFVRSGSTKKTKSPKVVDTSSNTSYNDEHILKLQLSALIMGIDTEKNLVNYSIENLEQLVNKRLNNRNFDHVKFQKRLDKLIQQRKNT
jgi:hypothetical protein